MQAKLKLWVDDIKEPPDDTWTWAKTTHEALTMLETGQVQQMSLDHDLGMPGDTRPIVFQLIHWEGLGHDVWPSEITVHSNNPPGRKWLTEMIKRYKPERR